MAKPIISIIGLGLVGTSLGLALQRQPGDFEVVGHDKDAELTQAARRQGAVQRTEWNLHSAYERAEMIIFAVPLSELRELLTHLRDDLQPGALVFITSDVIQPALQLARDGLPPQTHVVAGHPVLTGVGGALTPRADLFDEITFCIASSVETDPQAMQLASDLVERVGAKPLFVDAQEHDGIIAGVEQLPQLLAALLTGMNVSSPGWREGQRLAGRTFAQSTELGDNAAQLADAWLSNQANLLLRVDQVQQALATWRAWLATPADATGQHPLRTALAGVVEERLRWEGQAMLKQWDDGPPKSEQPAARGMFQQMFLGGLMGRRGNQTDRKNNP
jgi:prephenate dehydrogenase